MKKKPIVPILENMEIGQTEEWPIERYNSVRISCYRVNTMKKRKGYNFRCSVRGLVISVTRIS